jgi:hypothetical protein
MKAIEINGKISILKNLPKNHNTENGLVLNFNKLPKEELEALGYYDFVKPSIDKDTQSLGNVYFDKKKKVFTREIIEKDFDALVELEDGTEVAAYDLDAKKQELIKKLKSMCGSMLADTDWQVTRLSERGIAIDTEVAEERAKIIAKCDAKEAEVNALTKYIDALKYNTSFYTEQLDENGDVIVDEMGMPILAI